MQVNFMIICKMISRPSPSLVTHLYFMLKLSDRLCGDKLCGDRLCGDRLCGGIYYMVTDCVVTGCVMAYYMVTDCVVTGCVMTGCVEIV